MSDPTRFDDAAGLEHVTAALRALPATHAGAVDRVVAAALARRQRDRLRRTWALRAAGILVAAGLAAGGTWYGRRSAVAGQSLATAPTAAAPVVTDPSAEELGFVGQRAAAPVALASTGGGEDAPVGVAFALQRPHARRVAVVGDFDDWSPTAVPMQRGPGGTWTATVSITPGRHGYAFVVDDTVWVTDPRAPVVRDPDYGRDHSVVVVGQP